MKMEYKLIELVKKGFILTREPEVVTDELIITFTGAPDGATAIFENAGRNSLYRMLEKETCRIPADFLDSIVKCTVVVLNGKPDAPKYACESIYVKRIDGKVICCPNGVDTPLQIIAVLSEIQDIKNDIVHLNDEQSKIVKKLDRLIEGYDFE